MEGVTGKLDKIMAGVGEIRTDIAVIKSQMTQTNADRRLSALEQWRWRTAGALAALAVIAPPVWSLVLK